jgi:hypothetical protein
MHRSPRQLRLAHDLQTLQSLRCDSELFDFATEGPVVQGLPEFYRLKFSGKGLCLQTRLLRSNRVVECLQHEVLIHLVAAYPRSAPHLKWLTPIFHPNIATTGAVCLGGFGTHWSPGIQIDRLCEMLWDMCRWKNFDVQSPYNREAAQWAAAQARHLFPVDPRPLRLGHQPNAALAHSVFPTHMQSSDLRPADATAEPISRLDSPSIPTPSAAHAVAADGRADAEIVFLE